MLVGKLRGRNIVLLNVVREDGGRHEGAVDHVDFLGTLARNLEGAIETRHDSHLLSRGQMRLAGVTVIARARHWSGTLVVDVDLFVHVQGMIPGIETQGPRTALLRSGMPSDTSIFGLRVETVLATTLLEMLNAVHVVVDDDSESYFLFYLFLFRLQY